MVATVIHPFPSDGTLIARGISTAFNDGDTIDTGLIQVDGMIFTSNTDDTVATLTSQSAGVATVAGKTAGVAASSVTLYWVAWCQTRKG